MSKKNGVTFAEVQQGFHTCINLNRAFLNIEVAMVLTTVDQPRGDITFGPVVAQLVAHKTDCPAFKRASKNT